jgi:hypothetical protein
MEKIVYILGAGFSAPLGIPVMSNFLSKAKDLFVSNPTDYKHFKNVFDTINHLSSTKNIYTSDLSNIEEILSILEMQNNLAGKKKTQSFKEFISDVIQNYTPDFSHLQRLPGNWNSYLFHTGTNHQLYGYFIASLCNLEFTKRIERIEKVVNYDHAIENQSVFSCRLKKQGDFHYSVVTLNYDLVLEGMLAVINKNFETESPLSFNKSPISASENDNSPDLAKLHGSIDDGSIIPPTWSKNINAKILNAWKLAYETIKEANQIRIIGYSLPISDTYIKYLLKTASIDCFNLKQIDVICLDDLQNTVRQRYDDFIDSKNYRFFNTRVEIYLEEVWKKYRDFHTSSPFEITAANLEDSHMRFVRNQEKTV